MVRSCVVPRCKNKYSTIRKAAGPTLHVFPADKEEKRAWEKALKIVVGGGRPRVCSNHFSKEDLYESGGRTYVRKGARPFLDPETKQGTSSVGDETLDDPGVLATETLDDNGMCTVAIETFSGHGTKVVNVDLIGVSNETECRTSVNKRVSKKLTACRKLILREHSYAVMNIASLKDKLWNSLEREEKLENKLRNSMRTERNSIRRERRAESRRKKLDADLKEVQLRNVKLRCRLKKFEKDSFQLLLNNGRTYTERQKEFALTLYSCSQTAYDYMRLGMGMKLPNPRTLRLWEATARNNSDDAARSELSGTVGPENPRDKGTECVIDTAETELKNKSDDASHVMKPSENHSEGVRDITETGWRNKVDNAKAVINPKGKDAKFPPGFTETKLICASVNATQIEKRAKKHMEHNYC